MCGGIGGVRAAGTHMPQESVGDEKENARGDSGKRSDWPGSGSVR